MHASLCCSNSFKASLAMNLVTGSSSVAVTYCNVRVPRLNTDWGIAFSHSSEFFNRESSMFIVTLGKDMADDRELYMLSMCERKSCDKKCKAERRKGATLALFVVGPVSVSSGNFSEYFASSSL